jgi:single-stranded DNA-binding protein
MSVAILISGSIFREPQQRNSATGRPYVTATIKASGADNESSDFWNVLAFGDSAQAELLRLADGDKVSLQGKPKLEIFEKDGRARISRTVFADNVLALRAPPKERKPKSKPPPDQEPLRPVNIVPSTDLDDAMPF